MNKKEVLSKYISYLAELKTKLGSVVSLRSSKQVETIQKKIEFLTKIIQEQPRFQTVNEGAILEIDKSEYRLVLKFNDPDLVGSNPPIMIATPDWCQQNRIKKIGDTFQEYKGRPGEGKTVKKKITNIF